jgi:hypothetical protein
MKNYLGKIFLLSIAGSLVLPAFVFAAISTTILPAGTTKQNPISIQVSFDTWEETYCHFDDINNWTALAWKKPDGYQGLENWQLSTTHSKTFIFDNLPLGDYTGIVMACSIDGDYIHDFSFILGNPDDVLFEVIASPPQQIIGLPANALASTTGVIGDLINNLLIFIELAIGIPLAFYFTKKWLNLFKF